MQLQQLPVVVYWRQQVSFLETVTPGWTAVIKQGMYESLYLGAVRFIQSTPLPAFAATSSAATAVG